MSKNKQEPTNKQNNENLEKDDPVRISIKDVLAEPLGTQENSKSTTNNGDNDIKNEKKMTHDTLDEIKLVSSSSKMKDVSINTDGVVRKSRRTVIYIYLCPRFTLNLFSRTQHEHVQPRRHLQRRPFGFADGSYTVFAVNVQKEIGPTMKYKKNNATTEDGRVRNVFVRRVFLICSAMLLVTVIFTVVAVTVEPITYFLKTSVAALIMVISIVSTGSVQYTYCCSKCSKVSPVDYILNVIVTLCFSYMTAYSSARYAPLVIISASSITLVASLLCLALAYTSFDFTRFILVFTIALLSTLSATFICTGLMLFLNLKINLYRTIFLLISSVGNSTMLVVQLQMILGGNSIELGEDEYAFGAYIIYTSIINMVLKLLGVMNFVTSDED